MEALPDRRYKQILPIFVENVLKNFHLKILVKGMDGFDFPQLEKLK